MRASSSTTPCRCRRVPRRTRRASSIDDGQLQVALGDGVHRAWPSPEKFVGYTGELGSPDWSVLLVNNGLHIEILIDPESPIGKTDRAGIKDVVLESAITTIMDFEDSVSAVDADDKVARLPQLARPEQGRPGRRGGQGRQDVHPGAQPGPRLHHARRRRAHPARPQPAVRAQRGPPDDQRRDRVRRGRQNEVFEGIMDALFTGLMRHPRLKEPATRGQRARWSTAAPGPSTSSSRRCTVPTRSRSPPSCSAASKTSWGCRRPR